MHSLFLRRQTTSSVFKITTKQPSTYMIFRGWEGVLSTTFYLTIVCCTLARHTFRKALCIQADHKWVMYHVFQCFSKLQATCTYTDRPSIKGSYPESRILMFRCFNLCKGQETISKKNISTLQYFEQQKDKQFIINKLDEKAKKSLDYTTNLSMNVPHDELDECLSSVRKR